MGKVCKTLVSTAYSKPYCSRGSSVGLHSTNAFFPNNF